MIYVIGNSHANSFTNTVPGNYGIGNTVDSITSISIGPIIAYNFFEHHQDKVVSCLKEVNFNNKEDDLLLIVGEVDCRWHLPKHSEGKNMESVVKDCVNRFFRSYKHFKDSGVNIIGWGGHPSTTSGHNDDVQNPVYGDCLFRNKISKLWERDLKNLCEQNNIEFISIIDDLILDNGLTDMSYFIDYCHLNSEKLLNIFKQKIKCIKTINTKLTI